MSCPSTPNFDDIDTFSDINFDEFDIDGLNSTRFIEDDIHPRFQDNLPSSQRSIDSYSDLPGDISLLIPLVPSQDFAPTQSTTVADPGPKSNSASSWSLGKRTLSNISSSDDLAARPFKLARLVPADEDDPFLDKSGALASPQDKHNDPFIIAHSDHYQNCIEAKKLPTGVRYEIARLVTQGHLKFEDIRIEDLDKLKRLGSNAEAAPHTRNILLRKDIVSEKGHSLGDARDVFAKEKAAKLPWSELDKEERYYIEHGPLAGLGFLSRDPDWFGGKIDFRGRIKDLKPRDSEYEVVLEMAELGASNRFARRFGSAHFLRIKVPKSLMRREDQQKLLNFLRRPFILMGCVLRAFYAKEQNVFFFRTNEVYKDSKISLIKTVQGRLSFLEFVEWHNSLEGNANQTIAKWTSRWALGLSSSAPGLLVNETEINDIPDIMSAADSDMTDGAGRINTAGLRLLYDKFKWGDWPTAIQMRCAGAKGLLVHDLHDNGESAKVWLRPSQNKINYSRPFPDQTLRVIDILRSAHPRTPCRLSVQTTVNLWENGVHQNTLMDLLQRGLDNVVRPLLAWEGQDAMFDLWISVARAGGVMAQRSARAGLSRVKGYAEKSDPNELDEDEDVLEPVPVEERSTAWWGDEISGCPSSLEETVMYLLDSGFTPQNCAVLKDKLGKLIKTSISSYVTANRIDVPMSLTGFLVPDEHGVLQEGEIFFKSSRRNILTADGLETDIVLGDVLLTRHPCVLPTDVQKWKAVDRPELRHMTDVIVCSVKGLRRAADWLSGGDYDGDKGLLIYQQQLVMPFKNADPSFATPPPDINDDFSKTNELVSEFIARAPSRSTNPTGFIDALQKYLLAGVCDTSVVGMYANMHETAVYTLGYGHPETIRLAYMFCMTLDGAKTGMTVLPEVLKADSRKYNKGAIRWKVVKSCGNDYARRPQTLNCFIMDTLCAHAKKKADDMIIEVESMFRDGGICPPDADLEAPWKKAQNLALRWKEQEGAGQMLQSLEKIKAHVEFVYQEHRKAMSGKGSPKNGAAFTNLAIETRQDTIRSLSKQFAAAPLSSEVLHTEEETARLKASYAYIYDAAQNQHKHTHNWTRFPWDVTMRELCAIKAHAKGLSKTVNGDFYERFIVKSRGRR